MNKKEVRQSFENSSFEKIKFTKRNRETVHQLYEKTSKQAEAVSSRYIKPVLSFSVCVLLIVAFIPLAETKIFTDGQTGKLMIEGNDMRAGNNEVTTKEQLLERLKDPLLFFGSFEGKYIYFNKNKNVTKKITYQVSTKSDKINTNNNTSFLQIIEGTGIHEQKLFDEVAIKKQLANSSDVFPMLPSMINNKEEWTYQGTDKVKGEKAIKIKSDSFQAWFHSKTGILLKYKNKDGSYLETTGLKFNDVINREVFRIGTIEPTGTIHEFPDEMVFFMEPPRYKLIMDMKLIKAETHAFPDQNQIKQTITGKDGQTLTYSVKQVMEDSMPPGDKEVDLKDGKNIVITKTDRSIDLKWRDEKNDLNYNLIYQGDVSQNMLEKMLDSITKK
ncbi:hypothetical protein [Pseudalkalibacillus caeni]|uniref:DUF4367 domain-containing protein n=1 Tax=Exobacillus caeni TaxID=2574798 RepID=A0A5R9F3P8_9BACL|nr:hypothetical protein [Pseudalkalibacillus caeni]TLS36966.1 hypothetical protein FCL54_13515 [Pseudalkalibacillus caeni]